MLGKGKFFLVGGGPSARTLGEPFMARFIAEAGGASTRLTILTAGSDEPEEVNAIYWEIFSSLGVSEIFSPKIVRREDAEADWVAERIAETNTVFIAGGAQSKLCERFVGTAAARAVEQVFAHGGMVAGTSSGSSVFAWEMILDGGTMNKHLRSHMIDVGPGLGLLDQNLVIDTHFSSRGRLPRNISLMIERPGLHAIGIDEDTVLFIGSDGIAQVLGYNAVYALDGNNMSEAHNQACAPEHLCASGVKLHCLTNGDSYDLIARRPARLIQPAIAD